MADFFNILDQEGLVPSSAPEDDYTLVRTDASTVVEMNKGTAVTLTVPPNSEVPFSIGTIIELFQLGAGQVTVAAGVGVTIVSSEAHLSLTGQYSAASLRKRAVNTWVLQGDLTTV